MLMIDIIGTAILMVTIAVRAPANTSIFQAEERGRKKKVQRAKTILEILHIYMSLTIPIHKAAWET